MHSRNLRGLFAGLLLILSFIGFSLTSASSVGASTTESADAPAQVGSSAAVMLVQQTVASLASGSTFTFSPSAATTGGDALVVAIAVRAGGSVTVAAVRDSSGTNWTKGPVGYLSGANTRVELWYRINSPSVSSLTVTLSGSDAASALFTEWAGVATASALDGSAGSGAASSTTAATPQLTTANATDLVIGAVNYPASVSSTLATGAFAGLNDFSLSTTIHGRAAYAVTTASGNYRASWNLSGASGGSGGAILALKAAATASADTTPPTTSIACNGGSCGATYTSPVSVTLTANDNTGGSGVRATYFTTDGSDPTTSATRTTYGGPFMVSTTANVRFYSVDNAGNAEAVKSQTIMISGGGGTSSQTFTPVADAYVSSDTPNTNYGTLPALRVDGSPTVRSYLRFAVSGLGGTVTRATLRIYANSAQTTGFDVSTLSSSSWTETGITYANAPALAARVGSSGPISAATWKDVDVTGAITGSGTYEFALATANTTAVSLASRESANKPQLVIQTSSGSTTPAPLQIGAYWYGWYGSNGRHWQDGYVRADLAIPQAPALGQYDSRAPATITQQLDWAHQYGIDYFISSWWGAGSYEDVTTHDYLLTSPSLGNTKVAILYESLSLLPRTNGVIDLSDPATVSKLVSDVDYLARTYFSDPGYLRIDGKPVLEFYVSRVWHGDYAGAIATLRSTIKQRYGYDLYLIGDEVDWDGTPVPDRIKLFDAITGYTMYSDLQTPGWPDTTGYLAGVRDRYTRFKAVADQYGVRFIPDALPQFNDRGVRLSANHYVLPPEVHAGLDGNYTLFSQFLNLDGDFLDPTEPTLFITTWNEWHEDTEIEPTAPAASSTGPTLYTQGYTYISHQSKLLDAVKAFRTAHGG